MKTNVIQIPDNWQVFSIQELIDNGSIISHLDGNHGALYPKSNEFTEFGVPYISANDFEEGQVSFEKCKFLSEERAKKFQKGIAKDGDVLFAHNATVGPVALLTTDLPFVILSTSATYFRCNNDKLVNKYLLFAMQSPFFVSQYKAVMSQTTRFQVPITMQRKLNLVLPSTKDQTSIALMLIDIDSLITSLNKLIAKKKLIKQGAMQELLTGKRRLPGFEGIWEEKKLDDIGYITGAGVDKLIHDEDIPVRLVNYMDVFKRDYIFSDELHHNVTATQQQLTRCAVKKGDVFFTPSSETRTDIGVSAVAMEDIPDAVYSYHLVRLRFHEDWDVKFRTYIFKTKLYIDQAETICEGSGKRYVITLPKFRQMVIKYPVDKQEQIAIADVLSDMDSEITELEKQLDKYKQIKQGMMQELLTGRIRLI